MLTVRFLNIDKIFVNLNSLGNSPCLIERIATYVIGIMSSLVPIPKNKRGNKCDSDNYRQINAISSLMGKLFDSIVLEEQQDSLFTDLLQFGF